MEFQFEALSIIFIVIILLYAFLGLKKGVGYMLLYLGAPIIILFASIIFAQPLARTLAGTSSVHDFIYKPIYERLIGLSTYFKEENPGRELLASVLTSGNYEAVLGMGVPDYLAPIVTALILASIPVQATTKMIGEYVCEGATFAILYIVSAVILYVIFSIVLRIIKSINAKKKRKAKKEGFDVKPNVLSRIVGLALGVGVSALSIFFIAYVLELLFMPNEQLRLFLNTTWHLDDPNIMTIGKWIMTNNPLKSFLLDLFQIFNF